MSIIMELKINKFGELSSDPIFKDGKVIFPSFTNRQIAWEGEEWEVAFVRLIPLNKVDKKGQPMFRGEYILTQKIYTSPKSLAGALFGGSSEVKFFDKEKKIFSLKCGDHIEKFPAILISRRFQVTAVGEIWEWLEYEPTVNGKYVGNPKTEYIINKYKPSLFEGLPTDTPSEIVEKAIEIYNIIWEMENNIKEKYATRNEHINDVAFPKNYKVLLAKGDYETIRLNEGDPISPLNGHEYDVFRIGECRFLPNIKFIDEEWLELDNPPFSVDGDKDTILGVMDYLIAPDFIGGSHKFFHKLFGAEEPDFNGVLQARFLYQKTIKSRFAYETLHSQGDETTHHNQDDEAIKMMLEFEVPEDVMKEIVMDNELFTVHYIPTITRGLYEEIDFEEGVGAKDATWYSGSRTFVGVFLCYETKIDFKVEACERFAKEVKMGFTSQTDLPMFVSLIDKL